MVKTCSKPIPIDKICNTETGRNVLKSGKIGKLLLNTPKYRKEKILRTSSRKEKILRTSSRKEKILRTSSKKIINCKTCPLPTPNNKICNTETGRNVLKSGKIGRKIGRKIKSNIKINLPTCKEVNSTNFIGSTEDILKGMLYLENKYKNSCIPVEVDDMKHNMYFEFVGLLWIEKKNKFDYTDIFMKRFEDCYNNPNIRFIICSLILEPISRYFHANILICDKVNNTLERFDPQDATYLSTYLDKKLKKVFVDFNFIHLKPYIPPNNSTFQCTQTKENCKKPCDPEGFCVAWCIWYADLRISNPDIDNDNLYDIAMVTLKAGTITFSSFIRSYSKFLLDYKKTKIFYVL